MVCTRPIEGWRSPSGGIVFAKSHGYVDQPVTIPCGQCLSCRLDRSRQWAVRIVHESKTWKENSFLTLTYSDEKLPPNGLCVKHHQLFMYRLRKKYRGRKLRYYHVGEYGGQTLRPHYHTILFNLDFVDKRFHKTTDSESKLYVSDELDALWGLGNCYVGEVTWKSAAYCARYVVDKLTGDRKSEYGSLNPPYSSMSRDPCIGGAFFQKWKSDVFPLDACVINGTKFRVPRAYDRIVLRSEQPELSQTLTPMERLKGKRVRNAKKHSENQTRERLDVIEELTQLRVDRLKRNL